MNKIRIEWLSDIHDCELCGSSYSTGARVFLNGILLFEWEPVAHCYDGVSFDRDMVYREIFTRINHFVEESEE